MSRCVECLEEMDPVEAQYSLVCGRCAARVPRKFRRVRTLADQGAEGVGRQHRPPQLAGMTPSANDDEDAPPSHIDPRWQRAAKEQQQELAEKIDNRLSRRMGQACLFDDGGPGYYESGM